MCGRFILLTDLSRIVESFNIEEVTCRYVPSHSIFPGQQIIAVIKENVNCLVDFKWGLIPSWTRDATVGNRLINCRAETVAEKPSFRTAFKKSRCLILADGFYEWISEGKRKVPMLFSLKSGEPFGFAGLYEQWHSPEGQVIRSCTIITTASNELIAPIHDRMPVILPKAVESEWIDPGPGNLKRLLSLLKPYSADEMVMKAVDPKELDVFQQPAD
ncbi:MAG: SOS response-associated protein YedK [Syntrophus sp. SKADARSKE-3]|nr:SOS response-associated protein YedK [Syntrophus sp. SKADARSKE-3]